MPSVHHTIYIIGDIVFLQAHFEEGQLSVSGERMCTILVNCLED